MKNAPFLILLTSISSIATASPFDGLSIGVETGAWLVNSKTLKGNGDVDSARFYLLSSFINYTTMMNKILYGIEIGINAAKFKNSRSRVGILIAPKIGYMISDNTAFYFMPAIGINKWNWHKNDVNDGVIRKTISFNPSFGIQHYLNNQFFIKTEMGYKMETVKTKVGSYERENTGQMKIYGIEMKLGIGYTF